MTLLALFIVLLVWGHVEQKIIRHDADQMMRLIQDSHDRSGT